MSRGVAAVAATPVKHLREEDDSVKSTRERL